MPFQIFLDIHSLNHAFMGLEREILKQIKNQKSSRWEGDKGKATMRERARVKIRRHRQVETVVYF